MFISYSPFEYYNPIKEGCLEQKRHYRFNPAEQCAIIGSLKKATPSRSLDPGHRSGFRENKNSELKLLILLTVEISNYDNDSTSCGLVVLCAQTANTGAICAGGG